MCDYSLEYVASRSAKVGDRLISSNVAGSLTRGFVAVGEPNVAVCLLPGTELAFEHEVEYEGARGLLSARKLGQTVARFRHINEDLPHAHHDALEFADGKVVLLTHLFAGQHATVLQLPAEPHVEATPLSEETREPIGL